MKKQEKTAAVLTLIVVLLIAALVLGAAIVYIIRQNERAKGTESLEIAVTEYMAGLDQAETGESYVLSSDGTQLYIDEKPESEDGITLYELLAGQWSYTIQNMETDGKTATVDIYLTCPDTSSLLSPLRESYQANLKEQADAASKSAEIYLEDLSYRPEVSDLAWRLALDSARNDTSLLSTITLNAQLHLEYAKRTWTVLNPASPVNTLDERAQQLKADATADAPYYSLHYSIPETATKGNTPDPNAFGETNDPSVVSALLETAYAKNLIGDQTLVWNPGISFVSGSTIHYYLDESILMIEWQELQANTVATFSEVFVSDASQLRRKIAGDSFGDMNFETTSDFCKDTNAVLAVGGDFYNHARNCGIVVYNRAIYRYDLSTCDVCYITSSGDMLFSYRNQFSSSAEADSFVKDNDVLFSLSFGPVLIDNGVDVTPSDYLWGEINDTYARSALGYLGEHHYLTMNMNCTPEHYYLATLRDAANAMISKGCIKAYTLDGGQTATTAINGELINAVQFGWEKQISDIIYFASAVSED